MRVHCVVNRDFEDQGAMDIQALVQALSNTLDPSLGKQAEAALEEVRSITRTVHGSCIRNGCYVAVYEYRSCV